MEFFLPPYNGSQWSMVTKTVNMLQKVLFCVP